MFTDNVVLLNPLVETEENGGFRFSPIRDVANLKRYILYFPKLAIVPYCNPNMGLNLVTEMHQLLYSQRVISSLSPRQTVIPKLGVPFFEEEMTHVFQNVNAANGGEKFSSSNYISDEVHVSLADSLTCRIVDLLPEPHLECQIADILRFRMENERHLRELGLKVRKIIATFSGGNFDNIDLIEDQIQNDMAEIQRHFDGSGLFLGRLSLHISSIVDKSVIPYIAEAASSYLGAPPGVGAATSGFFQFILSKSRFRHVDNIYPRDYEYILNAENFGIFSKEKIDYHDDYLRYNLMDGSNIVSLGMPPSGMAVQVPNYSILNSMMV